MIRLTLLLMVAIFAAFLAQLYVPPLIWLKGASILFVPPLLFYGCLALPFPLVLVLIFYAGFLNDLFTMPQTGSASFPIDYPFGTSILLYAVPGLILHGFRPWFIGRGWLAHFLLAELSAILTPFVLLAQYGILSFQRRDFFYSDVIIWRILGPGVIAAVIAPCVFFILSLVAYLFRYEPELAPSR